MGVADAAGLQRTSASPAFGSARSTMAAGKSRTLVLTPSAAARRALRKAKPRRIKLVVTAIGDDGTTRTSTKTVTLKT
jgi:hypothetical protein